MSLENTHLSRLIMLLGAVNSQIEGYEESFNYLDSLIPNYEAAKEQKLRLVKQIEIQMGLVTAEPKKVVKFTGIEEISVQAAA